MYRDRTVRLVVHVTPSESKKIKKLAKQDERSVASWLYKHIRQVMQTC